MTATPVSPQSPPQSSPQVLRRRRLVRRSLHTGIATLVGIALILGDQHHGLTAAAAAGPRDKDIELRRDKPVRGVEAKPAATSADPAVVDATKPHTPRLTWPSPGVAEAAVPAPGHGTSVSRWNAVMGSKPPQVKQRVGDLPVWVGPGSDATQRFVESGVRTGPSKVRVSVEGRRGDALVFDVRRSDGVKAAGRVTLTVDYSAFRDTYGGGWANRLRLYDAKTGQPVATSNRGDGTLQAEVAVDAQPKALRMAAASSGGGGDFGKGDSSGGSSKWSIGGQSGAFEWQLPMDAPPGMGGPQPTVALQYSSSSLDGLTSATNNQVSVVGQGFDIAGAGAIERRYKSCSKDAGNQGSRKTGDLCFASENANLSMSGKSGDLFLVSRTSTSETWRLRGDDGTVVEKLWGTANGDQGLLAAEKGEYWRVTAKDGTKYYFGRNRLPGWSSGKPETRSTMTMPVYGNNNGEQCNKPAFADSWCQQAYRWNLDYVVDRHGNTMSLYYDVETNRYARNMTATTVSEYVRNSTLNRIEYGQRDGQVYTQSPVGKVLFTTVERCVGVGCGPSQPASYPDTPWDLNCTSTTNCNNHFNPTFWSQKRLSKVTTQVLRGTAFTDVQSWSLRHEYTNGATTGRALWLEAVTQTGLVGGDLQMPETNFDGVGLDNRVDPANPNLPSMVWYRVSAVKYGTGGDLAVTYSPKDCTAGSLPNPADNNRRCHPQRWTPPDQGERQDWFHKYVVTEATETDRSAATSVPAAPVPVTSKVEYLSTPAWHYNEQDGLADTTTHTWNQWRGYGKVRVTKGAANETRSVTETLYYRGMHGDRKADGTPRDVKITDSTGTAVDDLDEFSGQVREQLTFAGTSIVNKTINDYWRSPEPTAVETRPWGTRYAYLTGQKGVKQYQSIDGGTLNVTNQHEYDAKGRLVWKHHGNDTTTANDDTCTRYEYTENAATGLQELQAREQTVAVGCDKTWTNTQVLSDERMYYDGATSHTAAPTRGVPTKGERLSGFDSAGKPTYETVFTATYDEYGRRTSMSNALNQTVRTSFTPSYGPVTKMTETAPNGLQASEEYEPAWGEQIATTQADGTRAEAALDPLGRTAKVWNPGHPKATSPADVEFEYLLRGDASSAVVTKTRLGDNRYDVVYELYDGLQRLRQTQEATPAGGRLVTDYRYDSRGKQSILSGPYYAEGPPSQEILYVDDAVVPKQEVTVWDGAERPTAQIFRSEGQERYRTGHQVTATRQSIDPPQGQAPTTRITDARGWLTELRHYHGETWSGGYDSTKYTYTPLGQLKSLTDPAGNVWSYQYDVRGRRTVESDPDRGTTTYTYNSVDQIETTTDAKGVTTAYTYDDLGRRKTQRSGSVTGPVQIEWTYDTLSAGKPTSTTRWVNGKAYTTAVTGYDEAGRPKGQSVTLPSSEGKLAGTHTVSQTYTDDGKVATRSLPKAGDLAAETLSIGYNDQSLPTTLSSELGSYVRNNTYTPFEETDVLTLGADSGRWVQQRFEYEYGTRRLTRVVTDRETSPRRISDTQYAYDPAGNIEKITDTPSSTTGEPTDTQCFGYDYQRRLTEAWTPSSGDCEAVPTAAGLGGPAPYWHSWTFDKVGNRQTERKVTPTGATTTSTYAYGGPAQPNTLKSVTTTGPAGTSTKSFGYDATGNLTTRTEGGSTETLTWNNESKLESTSKGTSFVDDGDGNRLLRRDGTGTTLYLGETEILLGTDGQLHGTRYYTFGEDVVAVRTNGKLSWLLTDLHGTPTIAVDASNQSVQRRRTTPYGEVRGAAPADWPGQRGFHKGTEDPGTGLVHLGAREYDPTIGRFISVDPVIDPDDPQQLNGYAYANNNPVTFADSDGRAAVIAIPVVIPVVVVAVIAVIVYLLLVEIVKFLVKVIETIVETVWNFLLWLWEKVTRQVVRWVEHTKTVIKVVAKRETRFEVKIVNRIKWIYKKIADKVRKPVRKPDVAKAKPPKPAPKPQKPRTTKPQKPKTSKGKSDKPSSRGKAADTKNKYRKLSEEEIQQIRRQGERDRQLREMFKEFLDPYNPDEWVPGTVEEVDPHPTQYPDGTPKWRGPYDSKDFRTQAPGGARVPGGQLIQRILDIFEGWGL
ncbi:RHS repeat domain-containing protein [Kribbella sp. CA-247076]|uniref:RHS repeat domain-containing protein n=1 Tax=Kribbella sp. CA-247076 TaxID=3239941 RepID=UPI003D8EF2C7